MPVYIVIQIFLAGGWTMSTGHSTRGSTRGPRGPKNQVIWATFYTGKVNVWIWPPVDVARNCRDLDCVRAADRQRNR